MKAMVFKAYGSPDVLHLTEVERPTPKDNEVLIKVHATTVTFGDIIARNMINAYPDNFYMPFPFWIIALSMFGFRKPKVNILGGEFAGKIEAVGKDTTRFKVGDQVFGYSGPAMGANAEYLCIAEDKTLTLKPVNMTYEEAATLPYGAVTALPILRKANIQPGQKILINGASGGIGSAALQLAKQHFGAEVTGVCGTQRVEFVKSLGADHVIDYTKEDFTQNGETYDVILDVLGKSLFSSCKESLKPSGIYLLASFKMKHLFQMLWTTMTGGKRVICALAMDHVEDLVLAKNLAEEGMMKALIDKCYPLEDAAEAHRYIEAGHKKGHIVLAVAADTGSWNE